jgi:PadR family transcriptional regulator, regulatory protein PadR
MQRDLLTDLELMILVAVMRLEDEAYGVSIAREIETTSGRSVMLGAIYAALDRMERGGLISSRIGEPTAERGGRAKKFVALRPAGIRAVKDTQRALIAMWSGVPALAEGS